MSQTVQVPGVGTLQFPDGMSQADMAAAIKKNFPEIHAPSPRMSPADMKAYLAAHYQEAQDKMVSEMPWYQKLAVGAGKAVYDTGRGIGELVGKVSPQDIAQARSQDAALMRTGSGKVGNALGYLAESVPLMLAAPEIASAAGIGSMGALGSAATGAGIGALQGFASPYVNAHERLENTLWGGALGGALPIAGNALKGMYHGIVAPMTQGGREAIAARAIAQSAKNADMLHASIGPGNVRVPGSIPTLAEVSSDPGIAQLQRNMVNMSPDFASDLAQRGVARNAARMNVLQGIGKTDDDMAKAIANRASQTRPLYEKANNSEELADPSRTINLIDRIIKANKNREAITKPLTKIRDTLFDKYPNEAKGSAAWRWLDGALGGRQSQADSNALRTARTLADRVRKGTMDAADAAKKMRALPTKSKAAAEAITNARAHLNTPDYVVSQNMSDLMSAHKNIGDMLAKKGPNGLPENEAVARELNVIKKSLANQMRKVSPEFGQANKLFAELSKPIDQMKVGRSIVEKGTSALPKMDGQSVVHPEALAQALRGDKRLVAAATGFKRNKGLEDVLGKPQTNSLRAVVSDVARETQSKEAARAVGSPTAQYLFGKNVTEHLMRSIGIPGRLARFVADSPLGETMANRWISSAGKPVEDRIKHAMGDMLLNPEKYAKAAEKAEKAAKAAKVSKQVVLPTRSGRMGSAVKNALTTFVVPRSVQDQNPRP